MKRLKFQSCRTVAKPGLSATSGRVQRLVLRLCEAFATTQAEDPLINQFERVMLEIWKFKLMVSSFEPTRKYQPIELNSFFAERKEHLQIVGGYFTVCEWFKSPEKSG